MDPKRQKPRALSLTLVSSSRPELEIGGNSYCVRNLSSDGIGILLEKSSCEAFSPGLKLKGELSLDSQSFSCHFKVIHHTQNQVGLRFDKIPKKLKSLLVQILEPSAQASFLVPHPLNLALDEERNERKLWYEGMNGNELFVWFKEETGLVAALKCRFTQNVFYRELQGQAVLSTLTHPKKFKSELPKVNQFLASLPPPLPGTLLWQFLETGEQVYLPARAFQSKEVA